MRINCPLHAAAEATPRAVAVRDSHRTLTFRQLDALTREFQLDLASRGVESGNHIAILAQNSIEYVAILFAVARLHAVSVPLNTRLSTRELRKQDNLLNIKLVFADAGNKSVAAELFQSFIDIDSLAQHSTTIDENKPVTQLDLEREAWVIFTSGSSGEPKGVVLSLGNVYYNALGSNANIPLTSADTWLLSLPLFHVGGIGIVFRSILAGSQVYVSSRFDPSVTNQLIDSDRISQLSLVPNMLQRLLDSRSFRPFPKSLKTILLGGAPLSAQLRELVIKLDIPAITSYGMTETASQIAAIAPGDSRDKLLTSGRALRFAEIKIDSSSEDGVGEICVRGEAVCRRIIGGESVYGNDEGWLQTGDLGSLDANNYLTVMGRRDDMFISGGENIYPQEISNIAEQLPEVSSAAVIAVFDEQWGARPLLFVEFKPGMTLGEEEILFRLAEKLARYKLPKRVVVLPELPRTTLDKIDKPALVQMAGNLEG